MVLKYILTSFESNFDGHYNRSPAARSLGRHFIYRVLTAQLEHKLESNRRIYSVSHWTERPKGTLINKSFHAHLITTRANTKNSLLFRRGSNRGSQLGNIKPSRIYIALIGPGRSG